VNSADTDGTTCGRSTGALTSFTREGDFPEGDDVVLDGDRLGDAGAVQEVPLEEPTSLTFTPPSASDTSACRREMVGS